MSKIKEKEKFRPLSKKILSWDTAIEDAKKMIEEKKLEIARLRQAIKSFEYLRDSGQPFPGEGTTAIKNAD